MSTEYESAVMREMLVQARRCARLEMALEDVRRRLNALHMSAGIAELEAAEIHALIARIDDVLKTDTQE